MSVHLPADGQPATVTIRNLDPRPVLVQIEARDWAVDIDSAPRAADIIAVPPVVRIGPDSEQIVRLAVRKPVAGRSKRAFRLVVAEVPGEVGDADGLTFSLRMVLPVFVTPKGASPQPVIQLAAGQAGRGELVVANKGTAHRRLNDLRMAGSPVAEGATYILAGESKSWPLDRPLSALPETLEVRAETNRGPLVAEIRPHAR